MSIATINGVPSQALDENRLVTVRGLNLEATSHVLDLEVSCHCDGELIWKTVVSGLGPNPTSDFPTAVQLDYHFVYSPVDNVLVISGCPKSVIISTKSGEILREVPIEVGVVRSLNFLHVQPVQSSAGGLLIVSEATVDRLDRDMKELWRWESPGPIAKCAASTDLVIFYTLDFENSASPYRRNEIEIDSGRVASSVLVSKFT